MVDFLEALPEYETDLYINKKMKTDLVNSLANLRIAYDALLNLKDWNHENLDLALKGLVEKLGMKNS
jgi:glutamyl-tRNA synthetase